MPVLVGPPGWYGRQADPSAAGAWESAGSLVSTAQAWVRWSAQAGFLVAVRLSCLEQCAKAQVPSPASSRALPPPPLKNKTKTGGVTHYMKHIKMHPPPTFFFQKNFEKVI